MSNHEPVFNESVFSSVIDNFRRYFQQQFEVECTLPGKRIFYHWRQSLCFDPDDGLTEDDVAIRSMYREQFNVHVPGEE
jgi:hypothetical protein